MRLRTRSLAAIIATVLSVACTAAPPAGASSAPGTATTGASTGDASAPLKIGVLVPFTESALDSDIGASQRRAADLYLKLRGGKLAGRDVQLVYNDESALDAATNQVRIQQFLDKDHVAMLIGGAETPAAYQLRNAAEAAKVVYIDTNAPGNALTRATSGCTPSCQSRYVFRTAATSWQLGEPLGEWAAKNGQKDAFLVYVDDAFGTETAAAFADGLAKSGGRVTGRSAVAGRSGEWAKVVAAIKAQPTKTVFAAFITDDAEAFIAAWDAAGMRAAGYRLVGPGPLADAAVLKVTKQAGLGITTSFDWSTELDNAENRSFADEFKKAYKDEDTGQPLAPDGYATEMWTAMQALDEALKTTKGDARADALIAALEAVSFKSPSGAFSFDRSSHQPVLDIQVREVRASGGALVNAIVDRIAAVKDPGQ